jgi:hypothetical protein
MKYLVILAVILAGCATQDKPLEINVKNGVDNKVVEASFITMLQQVLSKGESFYEQPIIEEEWLYLADEKTVKTYMHRATTIVDYEHNSIAFTNLSDLRQYKGNIFDEYGFNEKLNNLLPDFVEHRSVLNCTTNRSISQWRREYDKNFKLLKQEEVAIDSTTILDKSLSAAICFTLNLLKI